MAEAAMILEVSDTELTFNVTQISARGDVATVLHLRNPSASTVAFKVKTTAPKSYCVRPNSGVLAPGADTTVQVLLQPPLPVEGAKSKDKFLVQATVLVGDATESSEMWKTVPADKLMENKLKCQWVFDSAASTGGKNGAVAPAVVSLAAVPTRLPEVAAVAPAPASSVVPAVIKAANTTAPTGAVAPTFPAPAATAAAAPTVVTRTPSSSTTSTTTTTMKAPSVGGAKAQHDLPSIVLILIVFLLGYLFGKFVI